MGMITLMQLMLGEVRRKRLLIALPFGIASIMAWVLGLIEVISLGLFPNRQITSDQVKLLRHDNVVSDGARGFEDLGIKTTALEAVLPEYLWRFRPSGQYEEIKESAKNLRV